MNLQDQKFYSQIGLISVEFAKLESLLRDIICLLIGSRDDFINLVLIEENNFHQNLRLLLKFSKHGFYSTEDRFKLLHDLINKLRLNRNLFIHGIWTTYESDKKEIIFICETKKIRFKKGKYGIATYFNNIEEFKLHDLERESNEIKKCLKIAEELFSDLEK